MSTPALDRATGRHELFNRVPFPPACSCGVEMPDGNVRENFDAHLDAVARAARATVAAALHDPDDDVIAGVLRTHRIECTGIEGVTCRECPGGDRARFVEGFLAGHEAATRARVVATVTELDALPVGSVVRDAHGYLWEHYCAGEWRMGGYGRPGASDDVADFGPFTVLHVPRE
ncbi:hypothetical protein ACWHA6_36330 [Streptomyces anthocyanicus]